MNNVCSVWILRYLGAKYTPNMVLKPMTLRLKVSCSTNWASQAPCHKFRKCKKLKANSPALWPGFDWPPKKSSYLIPEVNSKPAETIAGCLNRQLLKDKICAPNVGLEPTTLRLRVSCSTDWASQKKPFLQKTLCGNYIRRPLPKQHEKNWKQILQPCDQDLIAHLKKCLISSLKSRILFVKAIRVLVEAVRVLV